MRKTKFQQAMDGALYQMRYGEMPPVYLTLEYDLMYYFRQMREFVDQKCGRSALWMFPWVNMKEGGGYPIVETKYQADIVRGRSYSTMTQADFYARSKKAKASISRHLIPGVLFGRV